MATGNDPFADLLTLQRDMDRLMTRFGGRPRRAGENGHSFWMPAVDVYKQGDDMIVRVELPGVSPADIGVSVTGNMLTIKGERRQDTRAGDDDYVMRESTYGTFERRITMPQELDASRIRAQYRSGILEITVPGSALITPQTQRIQVGGTQAPQAGAGAQQSMGAQPQYGQPGAQQQYGQPGAQQQYGQPGEQPQYGQPGAQPGQPQAYGERQGGQPAGQRPAEIQGGWVMPERQQPAGSATPQTEDAKRQGEERHRTRLGSWLHGGDENR